MTFLIKYNKLYVKNIYFMLLKTLPDKFPSNFMTKALNKTLNKV